MICPNGTIITPINLKLK